MFGRRLLTRSLTDRQTDRMKEWQTGWRNDRPSASFGGVTWSMTPTTRRHKPFRWRLRSFLHVDYLVLISHHHHHHHYRHHYHHQVACSSNSITAQLSALFNKLQSHKHCKRPWTQKNSKNAVRLGTVYQLNCVCRHCPRPPLHDAWKRISSSVLNDMCCSASDFT